ncbi:MAG: molecular chaperone HtpG [Planctomycetota bacterium]
MNAAMEKHGFQAEVNEVLGIVVHSLYSHREVFLRELISNASDAIDQLHLLSLTDQDLLGEDREMRVELIADKDAKTLTIRDNGAGMSKEELISNLGTIARSGTKKLLQSLSDEQKKDVSLIGQFGVGFYSAFLVADRVEVTSRKAGSEEAWTWESEARGDFTVRPAQRGGRGTDIVLHLKEDAHEFLDDWSIRSIVRKYSDYVRWPIRLLVRKKDGEQTKEEWDTLNAARAIWARPKADVTDEQYVEFYKHLSHDWTEPLAWTHFKVEGTHELTGLLFVPSRAPLDLLDRKKGGVRLFVKRVFIMDDAQEILPEWLRFVRGVVDSEDLPLNVSREILQKDAVTRFIRKQVIGKTLSLLEELAAEGETEIEKDGKKEKRNRYLAFWSEFGRVLKEGVYHDFESRGRLARLLRFESSRGEGLVGLSDYVARMPESQKEIYYLSADSLGTAKASPHIEALARQGREVLFLIDPIDEWVMGALGEFEGKPLASVARGDLDLPDDEQRKKEKDEARKELAPLLSRMGAILESRITEVRVTDRLTDSPACLVADEGGISLQQERILREAGHKLPEQKRILELNPKHPLVAKLRALADSDEARFREWTELLHDQALLAEGVLPPDPGAFARKIAELMS